jgi:hypothetical protein
MRLNSYHKEVFVKAVMVDVPTCDALKEEIRGIVLADLVAQLPPAIAAIWNNPDLQGYISTSWGSFGDTYVTYPSMQGSVLRQTLTPSAKTKLVALSAQVRQLEKTRRELELQLQGVIRSCTTLKSLLKALPEFEKYMPTDADAPTSRMTPVIANVVSDFVKAGWPTTVKK